MNYLETPKFLLNWVLTNPNEFAVMVATVSAAITWIRKVMVGNHATRLEMLRNAASSAAGRILLEATQLRTNETIQVFLQRRIHEEGVAYATEFKETGAKLGLDSLKMAGMIAGEVGKNRSLSSVVGGVPIIATISEKK